MILNNNSDFSGLYVSDTKFDEASIVQNWHKIIESNIKKSNNRAIQKETFFFTNILKDIDLNYKNYDNDIKILEENIENLNLKNIERKKNSQIRKEQQEQMAKEKELLRLQKEQELNIEKEKERVKQEIKRKLPIIIFIGFFIVLAILCFIL